MAVPSKSRQAAREREKALGALTQPAVSNKNINFVMPPTPVLWPEKPAPEIDPEAPGYWQDLQYGNNNQVRVFQSNIEVILQQTAEYSGALAYDQFEHKVKILRSIPGGGNAGDTFSEQHLFALRVWCEQNLHQAFPPSLLQNAVKAVALRNPCHVVRDLLERLVWDGGQRLDTMASIYLGAQDTPYNRATPKRFLMAAVARAYQPGCKVDTCLVLEGPQGSRKSTAIRVLFFCPRWVNDTPMDLRNKDAHIGIQGKWAVEFTELDALSSADTNRTKAFLSLDHDTFRMPYETQVREFPRTCVFIGTSNEAAYLQDTSGGRRFWPLVTGEIDLHALARDREQLWAEAVHLYKSGERWHLSYEEEQLAYEEQDKRRLEHPMEAPIRKYIASRTDVTINEVLDQALDMRLYKANGREGRQVSQVLAGVFRWRRTKVLRDGIRVNGFTRPVGDVPAADPAPLAPIPVEENEEPEYELDDGHDNEAGE